MSLMSASQSVSSSVWLCCKCRSKPLAQWLPSGSTGLAARTFYSARTSAKHPLARWRAPGTPRPVRAYPSSVESRFRMRAHVQCFSRFSAALTWDGHIHQCAARNLAVGSCDEAGATFWTYLVRPRLRRREARALFLSRPQIANTLRAGSTFGSAFGSTLLVIAPLAAATSMRPTRAY